MHDCYGGVFDIKLERFEIPVGCYVSLKTAGLWLYINKEGCLVLHYHRALYKNPIVSIIIIIIETVLDQEYHSKLFVLA